MRSADGATDRRRESPLLSLAMMAAVVAVLALTAPPPLTVNVTKCLADHCKPQVAACTTDATCDSGIKCVIACKPPVTKSCVQGCIEKSLDQQMLEVGLCATANHCLPTETNATSV